MKALEGGLEPPTLWLTATRSSQLSYSSFVATELVHINYYSIGLTLAPSPRRWAQMESVR